MSKLATVHDAIREAAAEVRAEGELAPATFKVSDAVKGPAAKICENNGTSLSTFLRWCCILLVEDYSPGRTKTTRVDTPQLPVGRRE